MLHERATHSSPILEDSTEMTFWKFTQQRLEPVTGCQGLGQKQEIDCKGVGGTSGW